MNKAEFLVELEDDDLHSYEEWDSLSKMAVMAYFDKNFGIKLTLKDLKEVNTVSDLIKLAGEKIQ